ncbi:MAG: class I adenylate-forming enzyme family protein, partial [Chloroflexota bacterium]
MNLATLSERSVETYGTYDFIIFEEKPYTNQDMVRLSKQMANAMTKLGIKREDRIVVLIPNCPEVLISYLGLLRMGAAVVPVIYSIGPTELAHVVQNSEAVAIITDSSLMPLVEKSTQNTPALEHKILVDQADLDGTLCLHTLLQDANAEFETVATADDDLAVLLYTSGTTGIPKGVMLTHLNLYSNADTASQLNTDPKPIGLGFLPLSHSYGFTVMNASFLT